MFQTLNQTRIQPFALQHVANTILIPGPSFPSLRARRARSRPRRRARTRSARSGRGPGGRRGEVTRPTETLAERVATGAPKRATSSRSSWMAVRAPSAPSAPCQPMPRRTPGPLRRVRGRRPQGTQPQSQTSHPLYRPKKRTTRSTATAATRIRPQQCSSRLS